MTPASQALSVASLCALLVAGMLALAAQCRWPAVVPGDRLRAAVSGDAQREIEPE